jgi:FMN phosphatase YigB (HAD superfamily)
LTQALKQQGVVPPASDWLVAGNTLSHDLGVNKPSRSLYQSCLDRLAAMKIAPEEVLHVGNNLREDLGVAKSFGMRTALYAHEKMGLKATASELKDPSLKPDRLLTELTQIRVVLDIA